MQHNLTVDQPTFEALKGRKRHLIADIKTTTSLHEEPMVTVKPDYQLDDSLLVTQENTRNQVSFAIISIEPLHSRSVILGLFAPYTNDEAKYATNDLPPTVG